MSVNEERDKQIKEKLRGIEDYIEVAVRAEDVDFMSIVHFNEYLNYFDFGFVSITSKLNFNVFESVKRGIVFPVKKVEIEYTNSAIFGDIIKVHSRLLKIGNNSMTFNHECYRKSDNVLLTKGVMVRLIMDMNTNKLIKISDFFNDII